LGSDLTPETANLDSSSTFELTLTGMAHGGSAVGRHEGRAIFVPYGIPGERILARITQDKGRFAYAEQVEVLEASPARVVPRCKHFGACGGCHWQHIDYGGQLEFKRQVVADQMRRLGGLPDAAVHPTIPSPDPWAYRSHVTFHVTADGRLGFVGLDDRTVIPIEECHIVRGEVLEPLFLDPSPTLPASREGGENATRLSEWSNKFKPNERVRVQVGTGGELLLAAGTSEEFFSRILAGPGVVHYRINTRVFQVSAGSFFQVNLPQAEMLVKLALERLDLTGSERVLDLYSGVGLFTAFLADAAAHVTAVESFSPAVRDAEINLAEVDNVDLIEGAVEDVLPELDGMYDAALLDPPRAGMDAKALDALVKIAPAKIVYVSCDPATLARDAKRLFTAGYRLIDVQPVDMFPQTYHIESVAAFVKP
jgi:23S rRNA (uracil1939-C5)-methyltransferase